jgi:hypothetical protein
MCQAKSLFPTVLAMKCCHNLKLLYDSSKVRGKIRRQERSTKQYYMLAQFRFKLITSGFSSGRIFCTEFFHLNSRVDLFPCWFCVIGAPKNLSVCFHLWVYKLMKRGSRPINVQCTQKKLRFWIAPRNTKL